jgi:hypothetical protein
MNTGTLFEFLSAPSGKKTVIVSMRDMQQCFDFILKNFKGGFQHPQMRFQLAAIRYANGLRVGIHVLNPLPAGVSLLHLATLIKLNTRSITLKLPRETKTSRRKEILDINLELRLRSDGGDCLYKCARGVTRKLRLDKGKLADD